MTDERKEIDELLSRAAPELGGEVKARAMERMTRLQAAAPRPRLQRVATALGVAVVLLAVGFTAYSANDPEARMADTLVAAAAQSQRTSVEPLLGDENAPYTRPLLPYRPRVIAFAREHHPNDPQMLLAAGLLTGDSAAGEALLKDTAESTGKPEFWAAYVWRLRLRGPEYLRVGQIIQDPELPDREQVLAQFRRDSQPMPPDRLSPAAVAPVLAAIHRWQQADPKNAMPLVLKMHYLYGLHRDQEALARWQEAAKRPEVETYYEVALKANCLLLYRMGLSDPDTLASSYTQADLPKYSPLLRDSARIAVYEGRVAQLAGRSQDALAWCNATIALGRNLQQSARTPIDFLTGVGVEGVGAAPAWRWTLDTRAGAPEGPLYKGRVYFGKQHAYYLSLVGEEASNRLRDDLVRSKVRGMLLREYGRTHGPFDPLLRPRTLGALAIAAMNLLFALALVYLGVGSWRRAVADAATNLSFGGRLALAALALVPAVAGGIAFWQLPGAVLQESGRVVMTHFARLGLGLFVALVATVLLPLLAARWTRRPGARLITAWRGSLRRVLPISILLCAVAGLSLVITAKQMRRHWVEHWTSRDFDELAPIVAHYGERWTHPTIPPDAWRAEAPPG
jgi:hypothetical protein